jgi:hypothetical protein
VISWEDLDIPDSWPIDEGPHPNWVMHEML